MVTYHQQLISSDRLPNVRRGKASSLGEQQRSLDKVQKYLDAPVEQDDLALTDAKAHREWLMRIWNNYFCEQEVDPDTIWIGLCEGDRMATAWTKTFFSDYVENSVRQVMILGPEEYESKRGVNSASTVLAMWRALVKEADLTVLQAKRDQESRSGDKWRLRFHNHNARMPTSSIGVFEVSKWAWTELAREAQLVKELTFEKLEATDDDVILILRTLWERAADLGIDPATRVSFHANVLFSALAGLRPGCLKKVCYKDILLSILRDPRYPWMMKRASTFTIMRNKLKDSLSVSKSDKIKFSVFFVPFPLVCLGRLVVARAIQDNAFDAGFVDAEDFLTKPVLGDVDYIELKWKDEMLERPVFNLSYAQFNDIWHRACLVAGLRVEPRLYAMRVGAGARLDKDPLFSNALRNYILSHTGPVFDLQYQTSRIREDLMKAAFGKKTGGDNGPLFPLLRNISLSRDPNAPIDVTTAEWAEFEARKDATTLRAAMNAARQEKNLKLFERLKSRFGYLRRSWGSLKLADNRRKYFEEADRSRAQGQQPPQSQEKVSNTTANNRASRSNAQMADQVFQHILRKWNMSTDDEDPGRYIQLLVAYLNRCSTAKLNVWEDDDDQQKEDKDKEEGDDDRDRTSEVDLENRKKSQRDGAENAGFRCVICDLGFRSRGTLTTHYDKHKREKLFDDPFQCPECRRNNVNTSIEIGFLPWLKHLELVHGKWCTPYFQQALSYSEIYPCLLGNCGTARENKKYNSKGLILHFIRVHADELEANTTDKLKHQIRCPRCVSQGMEESDAPLIGSLLEWRYHFDLVHGNEKETVFQCYICQEEVRTARGLKSHLVNLHERREKFFAKPFQCPECIRAGHTGAPEIRGRMAWQEHNELCHNGGAKEKRLDAAIQSPETRPHYPCLFCRQCCKSRHLLDGHLDHAHREVFKNPFQCPECVRNGEGEGELFDARASWVLHVARKHTAHDTDSTICMCDPCNEASLEPGISNSRRVKRVKVKELEPELDVEAGLPDLPHRECSYPSPPTSDETSENWDLFSEEDVIMFTSQDQGQSLTRDPFDQKDKRKWVEDGLEPKDALEVVELEDIPIDPCLLALG